MLPPQNLPLRSINVIITNSPGTNLTEITSMQLMRGKKNTF